MHVAHMSLFYDLGHGYQGQQSVRQECYIHENNTFLVSFALQVPDGTVALRFDPEEGHMVKVRVDTFLVNGKEVACTNNGIREKDDMDFCYHGDPIYETKGDFSGDLEIKIAGQIYYSDGMAFATETYRQKEDIQRQKEDIQRQKEDIQRQLEDTKHQLELMEIEVQTMKQSMSWRCTKPLRHAGQMIRSWRK